MKETFVVDIVQKDAHIDIDPKVLEAMIRERFLSSSFRLKSIDVHKEDKDFTNEDWLMPHEKSYRNSVSRGFIF